MGRSFLKLFLVAAAAGLAVLLFGGDVWRALRKEQGGRIPDRTERLAPFSGAATTGLDVTWDDLLPAGWDPAAAFKGLDVAALRDGDPRATEALAKVQAMWIAAPANDALKGRRIRIPGFLVPLERNGALVEDFLLVPYFGACIHTPPPPANQIIRVKPEKPYAGTTMDAVWVTGLIEVTRTESASGHAGYLIRGAGVERYQNPAPDRPR